MKSKPVIILGAGGHAKVLIESLRKNNVEIIGLTTPDMPAGHKIYGVNVLGDDKIISHYSPEKVDLVNGVGVVACSSRRWEISRYFRHSGYSFAPIIHSSVIVPSDISLASGVQLMAGSIFQPGVSIGQDTIINTGAIIDHDVKIEMNCHIAPGVAICGGTSIGKNSFIGVGTKIIESISIGENCFIAAGSTIYQNINTGTRFIQKRN